MYAIGLSFNTFSPYDDRIRGNTAYRTCKLSCGLRGSGIRQGRKNIVLTEQVNLQQQRLEQRLPSLSSYPFAACSCSAFSLHLQSALCAFAWLLQHSLGHNEWLLPCSHLSAFR